MFLHSTLSLARPPPIHSPVPCLSIWCATRCGKSFVLPGGQFDQPLDGIVLVFDSALLAPPLYPAQPRHRPRNAKARRLLASAPAPATVATTPIATLAPAATATAVAREEAATTIPRTPRTMRLKRCVAYVCYAEVARLHRTHRFTLVVRGILDLVVRGPFFCY